MTLNTHSRLHINDSDMARMVLLSFIGPKSSCLPAGKGANNLATSDGRRDWLLSNNSNISRLS
jgi:hypothetical protein